MNSLEETLARLGVIPVLALKRPEDAVPVCQALVKGGLPIVEVTFRAERAAEAIDRIAQTFPDVLVGAGTVLTIEQAHQSAEAGAKFLVSPGFDSDLAVWCRMRHIPLIPGVATPTEVQMALRQDLQVLKFFPAEVLGGVQMLEAFRGPFGQVKFIPTGGIGAGNVGDYLRLPNVLAVGGSWMVKPELIASGDFTAITRLAREARAIVDTVRDQAKT